MLAHARKKGSVPRISGASCPSVLQLGALTSRSRACRFDPRRVALSRLCRARTEQEAAHVADMEFPVIMVAG